MMSKKHHHSHQEEPVARVRPVKRVRFADEEPTPSASSFTLEAVNIAKEESAPKASAKHRHRKKAQRPVQALPLPLPQAYKPATDTDTTTTPRTMTEVRARAARHKGQMNFEAEVRQMLYAFGDDKDPLPETVRVVDEILTDFIIETCHTAAKSAEISGRTKLKVDDFKFAIRKDDLMTGRVKELLHMEKVLKEKRTQFDTTEGKIGLERGGRKKKETKEEAQDTGKVEEPKDVVMEDDEDLGDLDDE